MKPSSFENAIRLQFDCLARKVVGTTVKDYNRELGRRANTRLNLQPLTYSAMKSVSMMNSYVKQSKN